MSVGRSANLDLFETSILPLFKVQNMVAARRIQNRFKSRRLSSHSRRKTLRQFGLGLKQKFDRHHNNDNNDKADDDTWRMADDKQSGVQFHEKVNRDGTARWFIGKDYINPLLKVRFKETNEQFNQLTIYMITI